ncbi:hypothetical protein DRE_00786 [Drechslerella stenobrocha 248]|uniref:Uncharacterized protein n=1 Tax=Drechslerella stenobrocha 248 TaxID=1043628 RepID=W7HYW8_9PEZI|nr:hypothetical protein DRE_00786 [Drechslerella stenobrocha 248]
MKPRDSCVDVEHKKRGRPRLRDVRHSFEVARAIDSRAGGLNLGGGLPSPGGLNGRGVRLPGPERVGRTSISSRTAPYVLSDPARQDFSSRSIVPDHDSLHLPRGQSFEAAQYIPPTAFLTTDLVVASSTGSFQDLLGFAAHDLNLRRTVYDLATDSPTDLKNLDRVLRCIKAIIQQQDPHYRTPPSQEVYNVLQRSSSVDLRAGLRGAPVIEEYFDFRRSDSAVVKGFARFYLSRASVYFVAMEVAIQSTSPIIFLAWFPATGAKDSSKLTANTTCATTPSVSSNSAATFTGSRDSIPDSAWFYLSAFGTNSPT